MIRYEKKNPINIDQLSPKKHFILKFKYKNEKKLISIKKIKKL